MINTNGNTQTLVASINNIDLGKTYDNIHDFIMKVANTFTAGVVFEELYVNIYNYAYTSKNAPGKKENGPVSIKIMSTPDYIKITLFDFGIPFNPIQRGNWTAGDNQIGGRGIDLVKAYTCSLKYERVFGANIVQATILQNSKNQK